MAGWKDEETLFHRTLPATAVGPTSKTAVAWHLKGKDIQYNAGLIKNYCSTVNMSKSAQFINSFLRYSRFWGPMKKNVALPIFDHGHPKIMEITFSFFEIGLACKKNQFIPSTHS